MKLVYAKGACSLSVHILMEELGLSYDSIRVSLNDKKVLESYNPRSYVPALVLDNGVVMTEATSILQYLCLENGGAFLPEDRFERAKCIEWLTFISTELHKSAGPLFHRESLKKDYLIEVEDKMQKRLQELDDQLEDNAFIMGNSYTVADMYALAILRILEHIKVSMKNFSAIMNYKKNLEESTLIRKVLEVEEGTPLETRMREFTSREYRIMGHEKLH